MQRPKVGDRVVVEARVTRVDENGFTFQVDSLTPITRPYDHQALISVWSEQPKPNKAKHG